MNKSVEIDLEKSPNFASALSKLASSILNQPKESSKEATKKESA